MAEIQEEDRKRKEVLEQLRAYQMQACLGLETCHVGEVWTMEQSETLSLANAPQHDNFPERFMIGSPHEKLRLCRQKWQRPLLLLVMQHRFSRNVTLA